MCVFANCVCTKARKGGAGDNNKGKKKIKRKNKNGGTENNKYTQMSTVDYKQRPPSFYSLLISCHVDTDSSPIPADCVTFKTTTVCVAHIGGEGGGGGENTLVIPLPPPSASYRLSLEAPFPITF